MEPGTTPQYLTCGGRASPTARGGISQWMSSVLAQCSYSSWEFGICAALAVAKVCSSLPKTLLPPFHARLAALNREQHMGHHPSCISPAGLQLMGRKMLIWGKSLVLYHSDPFFPYYFSSWRQQELLVWIEQGLSQCLSPWRQLTGWYGASCQHPQGWGEQGQPPECRV